MIILRNKSFSGWEQREFKRAISAEEVEAFMAKRDPNFAKKVSGVASRKLSESVAAMNKIKQGIATTVADPTAEGRHTLAAWGDFTKTNYGGADIGRNRRAMDEVINTTSGINEKINKKRGKGMSRFHSAERESRIDATAKSYKNRKMLQEVGERERKAAFDAMPKSVNAGGPRPVVELTPKEKYINAGLEPVTKPTKTPVSNTFDFRSTTKPVPKKPLKTAADGVSSIRSARRAEAVVSSAKSKAPKVLSKYAKKRLVKNIGRGVGAAALAGGAIYGASKLLD